MVKVVVVGCAIDGFMSWLLMLAVIALNLFIKDHFSLNVFWLELRVHATHKRGLDRVLRVSILNLLDLRLLFPKER